MQPHKSRCEDIGLRLRSHLQNIFCQTRDANRLARLGRQMGKSTLMLESFQNHLKTHDNVESAVDLFKEMPIEKIPLYVNHSEPIYVEAARWRLSEGK
jgi:hypothetical protein